MAGLIVEVTEDEIVRDLRLAQEIAARLRASGIKMAIDDFGPGYSSFASLRALPFVELKLRESFVKDCAAVVTHAAICQTAIADLQVPMAMGCNFEGAMIAPSMPRERLLDLQAERCRRIDVRGEMSEARKEQTVRGSDDF